MGLSSPHVVGPARSVHALGVLSRGHGGLGARRSRLLGTLRHLLGNVDRASDGDGAVDLLARIDRRYIRCETTCNTTAAAVPVDGGGQQFDFDGATEARGNEEYETVSFYIVFESDGIDRYVQRHVVATDAEAGCAVPVACEPWAGLPSAYQLQAVDVNGGGLADLAWRDPRNDWWYRVNTGAGFGAAKLIVRLAERERSALGRFVDLGGDGYIVRSDTQRETLDATEIVVIDKLPFASPGDPVMQARLDSIRERGGNPFKDY